MRNGTAPIRIADLPELCRPEATTVHSTVVDGKQVRIQVRNLLLVLTTGSVQLIQIGLYDRLHTSAIWFSWTR